MFAASHWDNRSQSLGLRKVLWKLVTFLGLYFLFSQMRILSAPTILYLKFPANTKLFVKHFPLKIWLLY